MEWLHKGAQPTDTVRRILSFKGVLYLKHLLRGVTLGLFDEATAMEKFTKWSTEHDSEFAKRQESHKKSRTTSRQPIARRTERSAPSAKSAGPATETVSKAATQPANENATAEKTPGSSE